jgi:hypothetical protein
MNQKLIYQSKQDQEKELLSPPKKAPLATA